MARTCYFKPMCQSSEPNSQWQDLPCRPKWVPALGSVCAGILRIDSKVSKSIFKLELFTLILAVGFTYLISDYFEGSRLPAVGLTLMSVGALWIVCLLVILFGRIGIVNGCKKFLKSQTYDQDEPAERGSGYSEIDYLLSHHPQMLDEVAQWALANDRALKKRHIYALRKKMNQDQQFDYRSVIGSMILKGESFNEKFGIKNVLDGALYRHMNGVVLENGTVSAPRTSSSVRRI